MANSSFNRIKKSFYKKFIKNKTKNPPSLSKVEKKAIEDVKNARSNFNDADLDTIDLAIYELMAAEERLNLLIKNKKEKE